MAPPYDVVALGSAIVDLITLVDQPTLAATGLPPGTMTLVDADEAARLWSHASGRASLVAGGSAANTCAGVAALGGRAALVGRTGDDELGSAFADDLRSTGVDFSAPAPAEGIGTGRCTIFVTPDGERTMRTYLGAAPLLDETCVDAAVLGGARYIYLEGYLWDAPASAGARARAVADGRAEGARIALTLSDPGCVERHRDEIRSLLATGDVDLLFGNDVEARQLTGAVSFAAAAATLGGQVEMCALTRGAAGAVVVHHGTSEEVPAHPVERVVDTTGAGDLFAGGFLVGLATGLAPADAARLGALAAADIISAEGARPHSDIRAAARAAGLLP